MTFEKWDRIYAKQEWNESAKSFFAKSWINSLLNP